LRTGRSRTYNRVNLAPDIEQEDLALQTKIQTKLIKNINPDDQNETLDPTFLQRNQRDTKVEI
jgi:hypothetical protein